MSRLLREALEEDIVATQPALAGFVRDLPTDLTAGSWDLVAYSFERGFQALWDQAKADSSGVLERPLLMLWRQSVELAMKSAILDLAGRIEARPGHDLDALFAQLLAVCAAAGAVQDDDLACDVQAMVARMQAFDPLADRSRYPTDTGGRPHVGIAIDLDQLYQAHWIVTTWCGGVVIEIKGDR